ncbi:MAG: hypothetical protein CVT64_08790 [Actinobacteria bacterium HGW-Actinobacteria-4]|nr:MAG: hypothetical protein CVT64_08790 [Actinobacteria bacterium HGW-Actinobacteria-4]
MSYYKSYDRDRTLPNPGSSPLGPRLIKRSDHDAIIACTDVHALAMLRGYLRSYMGVMGLLIMSLVGTIGALIYGYDLWALGAAAVFVASAGITIQVRRRATQWLSIVEARIGELQGGGAMEYSMRVGGDFAPTGLSLSLFGRDATGKDA